MKLYLFGGAEVKLGQVPIELKQIEEVIRSTKARQVLHIPFARTVSGEPEWQGDWFTRNIHLPEVVYLNASRPADLDQADAPLVFISGGSEHVNLIESITGNPRIEELIRNAKVIIGESAGSMVLGEYWRTGSTEGPRRMIKGLGILKNTVVEPHYTERNNRESLLLGMKETGARYGLGIDCLTAMVVDAETFPDQYTKIGSGLLVVEQGATSQEDEV
jgi:peptidase E